MLYSNFLPPDSDVSMEVQLVCFYVRANSLDVRNLALRFTNMHPTSLSGGRETEYNNKNMFFILMDIFVIKPTLTQIIK